MATMLFADEVVDPTRIDELAADGDVEVTERELDIAKQLVESLAGDFEPDKYHDTYREEVLDAHRAQGGGRGDRRPAGSDEEEEPVPDLMAALKASLDAVRDTDADGNGGGQAARRRPPSEGARPTRLGRRSRKKAATKS